MNCSEIGDRDSAEGGISFTSDMVDIILSASALSSAAGLISGSTPDFSSISDAVFKLILEKFSTNNSFMFLLELSEARDKSSPTSSP